MNDPTPIRLSNDFTTPKIEELERQEIKIDRIYTVVSTLLVMLGTICIVLLATFHQMWIGLVGLFLWTASFVAYAIWSYAKEEIYTKIRQAEEELLEQMVKEKENSK